MCGETHFICIFAPNNAIITFIIHLLITKTTWKSTYVMSAVTSMTPQLAIPTTASLPAPHLQTSPKTGFAPPAA